MVRPCNVLILSSTLGPWKPQRSGYGEHSPPDAAQADSHPEGKGGSVQQGERDEGDDKEDDTYAVAEGDPKRGYA